MAIEENEIKAAYLNHQGQKQQTLTLLKQAAEIENSLPLPTGISYPALSATETYADTLLAAGQTNQAKHGYQLALKRIPNRTKTLLGLARSETALDDREHAQQHYKQYLQVWHAADANLINTIS